jgi:hypothetical protein
MKSNLARAFFTLLAATAFAAQAFVASGRAADADLIAALKAKGAEVTEAQGEITGVAFKNKTLLTADDWRLMQRCAHLKTFACAAGFDDAAFADLVAFSELESFSSNGMEASDEGIRVLGSLKKLRSVAFFHPGKKFSGAGLAALADLPNLERLTVAGSLEFADDGMAAVAKLAHLKEFRTWHSGATIDGVRKLGVLPEIKSLTIGQRLASKPPLTLSDDTVVVLAGFKSLEFLTLEEARLTLPALSQLKQVAHLKKLTLDGIDLPESDVAQLRPLLPQTDVKWTAPNEAAKRRIDALFGAR